MARTSYLRRPTPRVQELVRAAKQAHADAEKFLAAGDCGEAADALMHAYRMTGEAEGYVRALREMKGRTGSPDIKTLPYLYRTKVKIRRACKIG